MNPKYANPNRIRDWPTNLSGTATMYTLFSSEENITSDIDLSLEHRSWLKPWGLRVRNRTDQIVTVMVKVVPPPFVSKDRGRGLSLSNLGWLTHTKVISLDSDKIKNLPYQVMGISANDATTFGTMYDFCLLCFYNDQGYGAVKLVDTRKYYAFNIKAKHFGKLLFNAEKERFSDSTPGGDTNSLRAL